MAGLALLAAVGFSAAPAEANPLTNCFERIAVAMHPAPHHRAAPRHHVVHRVHHVGPRRHRRHIAKAALPTAAYAHRTRYILRPRACGTNEAMMTPALGAPAPDAPELLLSELAGPPPAPVAADLPETPGPQALPLGDTSTPDSFFSGGTPNGGVTPGGGFVFPGGGPGGPGQPPVNPPPDQPPVTPPDQPPDQPPVLPPDRPPITPPDQPSPPVIPPPPGNPPVLPPGVPEPATWAMLIVGFFGVGSALRRRRARLA